MSVKAYLSPDEGLTLETFFVLVFRAEYISSSYEVSDPKWKQLIRWINLFSFVYIDKNIVRAPFKSLCSNFFLLHKMEKNCAIEPSGQRALNTMTTNCDPMRVKVFPCRSRLLSWWWLTLSCTDRAGSHDEPRDFFISITLFCQPFCICSWVVALAMEVQLFWFTITWSFTVQTRKILTHAYRSRIVRGQSTLKDVTER